VIRGTSLALGASDKVLVELYKEDVCAEWIDIREEELMADRDLSVSLVEVFTIKVLD